MDAVRQDEGCRPRAVERLLEHAREAERVGARGVLVTCSTVSPCVDEVRKGTGIPVVKIDEEMIARAVRTGRRIGVIATNAATLGPTSGMIEAEARRTGKVVSVSQVLVEGAMAALLAGDARTHDRQVAAAITGLAREVDVIVLAQASMARVLDGIQPGENGMAPILASPELALDQVERVVFGRA